MLPCYQDDWVAMEKIHGANFSIYCDTDGTYRCAKRSGFINEDESFYGYQYAVDKYLTSMFEVVAQLKKPVVFIGELAGKAENCKAVQKEVEYGDLDIFLFDIKIDGEFVNHELFTTLCEEYNLNIAPVVANGSFEEMLALDCEFDSKVLGKEGNASEGLVLKPYTPAYMNNESRAIIKKKSKAFSENKRNHGKEKTKAPQISEANKVLLDQTLELVNKPRVQNALSKMGEFEPKMFGKLVGHVAKDVFDDANRDFETSLKDVVGDDWNAFSKAVHADIASLIRDNLQNIIDGEF